jgi:hypothetical protein
LQVPEGKVSVIRDAVAHSLQGGKGVVVAEGEAEGGPREVSSLLVPDVELLEGVVFG